MPSLMPFTSISHSDADDQVICSDSAEKRIDVEDTFHLPTNCEQQVITMGSSNSLAKYSTILEYEEKHGHTSVWLLTIQASEVSVKQQNNQSEG
jgi:hypothetical protein